MIITSIAAENLLKYSRLELMDLPEAGVIAISGLNESGKSTIGETICFALFGRTFSLTSKELEKVIRWGGTDCHVTLTFRAADGDHYELYRSLDNAGNHGVRLSRQGEEQPVSSGKRQVAAALNRLLGYGYDEFIESFYPVGKVRDHPPAMVCYYFQIGEFFHNAAIYYPYHCHCRLIWPSKDLKCLIS